MTTHRAASPGTRLILSKVPEYQSAPTSKKFSPGGQYQPSKAWTWPKELIGHAPAPGEKMGSQEQRPENVR